MAFTTKQQMFIVEYPKDFNATQAAIRAGYSEKTAYSIGHELLKKPEISAAIQERINELTMPADEVLIRLAEQARAEYSKYIKSDGSIDVSNMIEDGKAHLIKSTKWDKDGRLIVEFYDAHAALVDIGKAHSLFTDRQEITGPDGGPIEIKEIRVKLDAISD